LKLSVLSSGSGGNALCVSTAHACILVDAGVPPAVLAKRLATAGLDDDPGHLAGVCLTHEHDDHAAHAAALCDLGVPVFGTRGTLRAAHLPETRELRPGLEHRLAEDLWVDAVAIPHDAAEPCGFLFSEGDADVRTARFGVLTDCGRPDRRVAERFRGLDALLLESTHDPEMLATGPYPRWLKRRVAGPLGHLSNGQAAELLAMIGPPWPTVIVLAHLSANNNRPEFALAAIREVVGESVTLVLAEQARPIAPIDITGGSAVFRAPRTPLQLELFPCPSLQSRAEPSIA
jgi:phosphoribosyl 1,2-cyclic phosphodiesterase